MNTSTTARYLFIAALAFCVLLVFAIWADGLASGEENRPGYYRSTAPANVEFYQTRTAEYENYALGTPTPEREHGGHGRGAGQGGDHDSTPTPTIDWVSREDDQ